MKTFTIKIITIQPESSDTIGDVKTKVQGEDQGPMLEASLSTSFHPALGRAIMRCPLTHSVHEFYGFDLNNNTNNPRSQGECSRPDLEHLQLG